MPFAIVWVPSCLCALGHVSPSLNPTSLPPSLWPMFCSPVTALKGAAEMPPFPETSLFYSPYLPKCCLPYLWPVTVPSSIKLLSILRLPGPCSSPLGFILPGLSLKPEHSRAPIVDMVVLGKKKKKKEQTGEWQTRAMGLLGQKGGSKAVTTRKRLTGHEESPVVSADSHSAPVFLRPHKGR